MACVPKTFPRGGLDGQASAEIEDGGDGAAVQGTGGVAERAGDAERVGGCCVVWV